MSDTPLIDAINSIDDFKRIPPEDYGALSGEIRSFLVDKVSRSGGHLASNLGVVELTIAIHSVFDSPSDKIIFDVGHQAYVHKILTGRAAEFDSLRQKNGISGFPRREESPHDAFGTGHASTSVSAAIGMLRANALTGGSGEVVAVVGDGALTGGLVYEAMNDAGQSKLPLIMIVNDNDMSIAHNVGATSRNLYRMRSSAAYQRFKGRVAAALRGIPGIGMRLSNAVLRFKNRIKYLIVPNVLFEELGFTYLGPIDGHNIREMISVLKQAKELSAPVAVHVITKKGRGYTFAERNPEKFHGIGSFDALTGSVSGAGRESNSKRFARALIDCAREDGRVAAITAAMPQGTGLDAFAAQFPERFYDVGIAEAHAITMAAGMAAGGAKPVAAIYSTFLQRAYDQIVHDVCLQNLPVVMAIDRAGLVGEDGATHQGIYDISFLRGLPGMTLMSPATGEELSEMIKLALTLDSPSAIRYNRGSLGEFPLPGKLEYGKWRELKAVSPVTVVATGRLVQEALKACSGLNVGVVSAGFLSPLDEEMVERLGSEANIIVTAEDGVRDGGFGAALAVRLSGRAKVYVLGVGREGVCHASVAEQDEENGISARAMRQRVLDALEEII